MTHAALVSAALFGLLTAMTVLLVLCLIAVILAPAQRAAAGAAHEYQAAVPQPPRQPPAAPTPPLPRKQPAATALAVGFHGWSASANETTEFGALQPLLPIGIERLKVSGGPPWEPAPKPPGVDVA
jgi:hypothetical protein